MEGRGADLTGRAVAVLPPAHVGQGCASAVTVDLDSTDVEVYGSAGCGVQLRRAAAGRPHLGTWAEAGLSMAAGCWLAIGMSGLLRRAPGIPGMSGLRPARRIDCGCAPTQAITADLAHAALGRADFAVAAKRNTAWRAYAGMSRHGPWRSGSQVAAGLRPAGCCHHRAPGPHRRRYHLARPRSRRRRTIRAGQLALALEGAATHAYAVSFIVATSPGDRPPDTDTDTATGRDNHRAGAGFVGAPTSRTGSEAKLAPGAGALTLATTA